MDLKELPLALGDAEFDVVILTQVVHHLPNPAGGEGDRHQPIYDLMAELARVTRGGGSFLWCQTQTEEQHAEGFWWGPVVRRAQNELAARFPPMEKFTASLCSGSHGFSQVGSHIPDEPLMRPDIYLQIDGPFKEDWRNCDSGWSMVTPEELTEGLAFLRGIIDRGEGEKFMAEREAVRGRVGQTTTIVAVKN